MHSSELPVTEWWAPAEDVYSVPPCPQGDGRTDANLWTEAFLFSATIGWIWADYDGYWGPWTRQLTTGCTCRDVPRWYPGRPAAPGCPTHSHQPTPAAVPPCTCRYGLHPTIWCPTHLIDVAGVGQRAAAYTIRIDPDCPHHGDDLLYPDGGVWGFTLADTVLDEDERRGH